MPVVNSQTLTDGATVNWDLLAGAFASVTLGGNRALANPSNVGPAGMSYTLKVVQDGTGSRTLSFGSAYLFAGGVDPVLSTAASAVDYIFFVSDGTNLVGSMLKAVA